MKFDTLTLFNFLLYNYPFLIHLPRCGILHRLDKDTTGLLIVAKTLFSYNYLLNQFKNKDIMRNYVSVVYFSFISGGTVSAFIGNNLKKKNCMSIVKVGSFAITHYRIIVKFLYFTFIKLLLKTGKTHQIRIHMKHINHNVVGDLLYVKYTINSFFDIKLKNMLKNIKRQMLHSNKLIVRHPYTSDYIMWESSLPDDFNNFILELKLYDNYLKKFKY